MIISRFRSSKRSQASLQLTLSPPHATELRFREDTELVDGIGGTTWEGSLLLAHALQRMTSFCYELQPDASCHVLELGCGTALSGIVAASLGFKVTVTDREPDLAEMNVQDNLRSWKRKPLHSDHLGSMKYRRSTLSSDADANDLCSRVEESLNVHDLPDVSSHFDTPIVARPLSWSPSSVTASDTLLTDSDRSKDSFDELIAQRGKVDVVLGAEITCLRKQQDALVDTLSRVASINPNVLILLTFDGLYNLSQSSVASDYEREFLEKMKRKKFQHGLICQGEVSWDQSYQSDGSKHARVIEYLIPQRPGQLSWPTATGLSGVVRSEADQRDSETFFHHVLAFYRSNAVQTCQRCHQQFLISKSTSGKYMFNSENCCKFHPGYYVCRKHPAETRLSINGLGDQLGYYSNGLEGWKAEFWDCCGSEDPDCVGCKSDRHIGY